MAKIMHKEVAVKSGMSAELGAYLEEYPEIQMLVWIHCGFPSAV